MWGSGPLPLGLLWERVFTGGMFPERPVCAEIPAGSGLQASFVITKTSLGSRVSFHGPCV